MTSDNCTVSGSSREGKEAQPQLGLGRRVVLYNGTSYIWAVVHVNFNYAIL
jgi:hypothetical protein